jgi:hypothetical protein
MNKNPSNIELWSELWANSPLKALAMLIVDPRHLENHVSHLAYLERICLQEGGEAYFEDSSNWEIFDSEWFDGYAYQSLEGLTETIVAQRIERIFIPLLEKLAVHKSTRFILKNLVQTILSISADHQFSILTPLHHLSADEYFQVLLGPQGFASTENPLLSFLIDTELPKEKRHVRDIQHYLQQGEINHWLDTRFADCYMNQLRFYTSANITYKGFFSDFQRLVETYFPNLGSRATEPDEGTVILLSSKQVPLRSEVQSLLAAPEGSPLNGLETTHAFDRVEHPQGFEVHCVKMTNQSGEEFLVVRIAPHAGHDSQINIFDTEPQSTGNHLLRCFSVSDTRGWIRVIIEIKSIDGNAVHENCLIRTRSPNILN